MPAGQGHERVYALDLARTGVEPWLDAIMSGRRPPRGLALEELERALQAALANWHDDAPLASSRLWEAAPCARVPPEGRTPAVLREQITTVLERAREEAGEDQRLAYRAVELAYLTRGVTHEAAAARLAVSRATVYRLLKRAVQGLARALAVEP